MKHKPPHYDFDEDEEDNSDKLLGFTVDIVTAHLAHNNVALADVPGFIHQVHSVLSQLGGPAEDAKPEPIVPISQSVKPDYIVCLECGRKLKTMKAHLRGVHSLDWVSYREKWGLPASYPAVSAAFKKESSERAIRLGLHDRMLAGRKSKQGQPPLKAVKTGRK